MLTCCQPAPPQPAPSMTLIVHHLVWMTTAVMHARHLSITAKVAHRRPMQPEHYSRYQSRSAGMLTEDLPRALALTCCHCSNSCLAEASVSVPEACNQLTYLSMSLSRHACCRTHLEVQSQGRDGRLNHRHMCMACEDGGSKTQTCCITLDTA